ncbi:MAG: phosphatidylserine decarboxylase family protein [Bacteroidetes bacterium]|nr:phosphatidylserine decarboxylase family protein [Bacteroidota bacterium]MCK5766700.1 phosphatidylserine decarboxylase family protein [Bacteroidales bacterium]
MKIHTAGIIPILVLLAGVLIIMFLLNRVFPEQTAIHYILYAVGLIFIFFVVRFFRFPDRKLIRDSDAVYSGADGTVVAIEKVHVDEYFNDERIQISVFMSIFNVHINWSPFDGKLVYRRHHHGKHLVAFNPKSSLINEHTSLVIQDEKGRKLMMRQIAGAIARRIICKPTEGQGTEQGEMIGMIKFGSRIDLFLPADAEVKVKIGDKARGAQTLMAILK